MTPRPSRSMTSRPSRPMTSRPSRLMTPRPSRPHLGPGHSTLDHNAAPLPRYANCGRARPGHQSLRRSGYVTARVETAAGAYAPTPPDRASTSRSAPSQAPRERAPNATSQRRWGGSTPNHPAALSSEMRMGFKPPEQHHTIHSPNKRERTQVF
jgi:hypothetical protein